MKKCFTPHVLMHSLIGLGLGIFLAALFSGLRHWWLGGVIVVVAVVWDMTKKA
ncbi:MAG TPA: hypothetical protein VMT23_03050 [Candidatus Binatia bacterium]|nr:hypothetical protein [Candidatus Binatia bacterium]